MSQVASPTIPQMIDVMWGIVLYSVFGRGTWNNFHDGYVSRDVRML
jgi:hypothetical protein